MLQTTPQIELAAEFLRSTGVNIFLTGKAGTGKTTFLHSVVPSLGKRAVVAAPTGVAAINARGVTLHSLFQLPFGPNLPKSEEQANREWATRRMSREKLALIRSIELLVIDEISMVRSDLLDAVDETLRRVRHSSLPFGGVQLLMIGDVQQLSPICRDDEWQMLRDHYTSQYFFDSNALNASNYITIELREIFRQRDSSFTTLLNAVRDNRMTNEMSAKLNTRYLPNFEPSDDEGYITLSTHNARANSINATALGRLTTPAQIYRATTTGDYPEMSYPNDAELELKVGAQVIFIKNDPSPQKLFYNGMIGRITAATDEGVSVRPNESDTIIEVSPATWENLEYKINSTSGEIEESVKGTYTQIPLKCAWAITIHKSQGLSFDKAIIDAGNSFAYGQVYVALSRCRTFEGMVLRTPINTSSIIGDTVVEEFNQMVTSAEPSRSELTTYQRDYYYALLCDLFDFDEFARLGYTISKLINSALYTQYPKLATLLSELVKFSNPQLKSVAQSFRGQLQRAIFSTENYATDSYIAERLKKSSAYFLEQLSPFRTLADEISTIKPDAKEVAKRLKRSYDEFAELLAIKEQCIALCGEGYSVEKYLATKARVIAERSVKAPKAVKSRVVQSVTSDIINAELYETLTAWRYDEAKSQGIPAYNVLTNRAIIEIQATLPTTIERLKKVNGIGEVKLKNYGDAIVEMVREFTLYCEINVEEYHAQGIGIVETIEETKPKEPKPKKAKEPKEPKVDSYTITLALYNEGASIDEIAQQRSLTRNTIEIHIAKCISLQQIELEDVVDHTTIEKIRGAIEDGCVGAKAVYEYLNEKVTYGEIRLVFAKYPYPKNDKEAE